MCAPCKVVINEGASNAAALMTVIRQQLVQEPHPDLSSEVENEMYLLAEREVAFIEDQKAAALRMAKRVGAGTRWVKLMERL